MSSQQGPAESSAVIKKFLWACLFWCCLAATVPPLAAAQTAVDGTITGFVVDVNGAAIVGATIEIQNTANGIKTRATTEAKGEFTLLHLPAGEYQLSVKYALVTRLTLQPVTVEVGAVTSVDAHLRIGPVTTSIDVTAEPDPTVSVTVDDLSSAAIASVITRDEIDGLPVNGRRWQTFAQLTPGVNDDPEGDGLLSFRGLASTQNSTRIDGGDDDQSFASVPRGTGIESGAEAEDAAETGTPARVHVSDASGGGGYGRHSGMAYTFSQEAVREFRVSSQNYSALYGHAAGGIITTVSKGGTNDLHGTAFYLLRTSALSAANPFSIATTYTDGIVISTNVKPHDLRQQFGGSLGGASIRDKLFYFYAYDQQTRDFPAISTPADPNFFSLTPTQKALLANRGVTAAKVNTALNYLDSLTGNIPRQQNQTINFGKLDWQAATHHRLSLQYNRARSNSPSGVRSSPVVDLGRASLASSNAKIDALLGRWLWLATPTLSNEIRAQYGRDLQYEQTPAPLPQEPAIGPGNTAPEVAIGPDGFTFGTSSSFGRNAFPDENKIQLVDILTWAHHRHQLQLGADISFVHDNINALTNTQGAFHYDTTTTSGHAGGLVDWITDYTFNVNANPNGGCPSIVSPIHDFCFRSFTQSFGQQAVTFNTQEWAAFLQDAWRIRPGLTLNAGLRYEYELLPIPQQPNALLDAAFGKTGATSVFPEDRNNLGPRIGIGGSPSVPVAASSASATVSSTDASPEPPSAVPSLTPHSPNPPATF